SFVGANVVLAALEVIFMGRLLTFNMDDTLFSLVENIEAWNSFPWDRNYVPTYTLSSFEFAFQESRSTSDLRPTIAEYQSSWWIDNNSYFQEFVPKAPPIKKHHGLFETYISKLEKARKRGNEGSCFHRLEEQPIIFMFADLIEPDDLDEDIAQDYLLEEELRLRLEGEEKMCCKHQKLIVEENRIRLDQAKRNFWLKLVCLDPARKGWLTEEVQLPVVLERANIFQKNRVDPSKYTITFRLADNVPKQGAYMVIVLAMPSHFHKKFYWGTVFANERRSFIRPGTGLRMKRTNRSLYNYGGQNLFMRPSTSGLASMITLVSVDIIVYSIRNMVRTSCQNPTQELSPEPNPDIATIIVQQLQNIIPQIVTQVTTNVNNANGGNENGGNSGCLM
nr:hypothetical protein [Tanacetum cinerariifolium]